MSCKWTRRMHGLHVIDFHCTFIYILIDFTLRSKAGAFHTSLYANRWTDAAVLLLSNHCVAPFPVVMVCSYLPLESHVELRLGWVVWWPVLLPWWILTPSVSWWSGPFLCGWKELYPILFCEAHCWVLCHFLRGYYRFFTVTVAVVWRACLFESQVPDIIAATALSVCAYHIDFLCNRQHCMA